ncbi:MAG: HAD-IC family P-type ATPase [Armatimonadota bacterium]|nr:MAG: HAD-IC family P-type ATPase [Armatimonadota bacterium]
MTPATTSTEQAAAMAEEIPRERTLTATTDDMLLLVGVGPDGLDDAEARERLEQYGPNRIARGRALPAWRLLLDQVRDPIIYVLLVAGAVTLALRHYTDTGVILFVVVLNGIIGFVQEFRANRAIDALSSLTSPTARVRRAGRTRRVPSEELVPGDLVLVQAGAGVDADARLLRANELLADESLLTGESLPVEKTSDPLPDPDVPPADQRNMLFAGSLVLQGRGEAVVVRTGPSTELGKIAETVTGIERVETPLQRRIRRFSRVLALATLGLVVVATALGALRGIPVSEMFLTAVALAVSAIPEGLPVVVTITLAVGVSRMAARNAVVRKLPAVETLGSTQVICSDKTGTLTLNHMAVRMVAWGPWTLEAGADQVSAGESEPVLVEETPPGSESACEGALCDLLRAALFCNNAERMIDEHGLAHLDGAPTEAALLDMVAVRAPRLFEEKQAHPPEAEVPFSSERKFMATVHERWGGWMLFAKGSPEVIIERCAKQWVPYGEGEEPLDAQRWLAEAHRMADAGQRVIAVAHRPWHEPGVTEDAVTDLTLLGLIGLMDPPRPEAAEAVRGCQESGIRVVMVTGDHVATARAVAMALGILQPLEAEVSPEDDPRILTGREVEAMSDEELAAHVDDVAVYARVTPLHKLRIVQELRKRGYIVAVTGDGVNDAPALRQADLGVAMGKVGTEVAKQAADMVLLDDSFATIYEAVKQGRYIFENIRKVSFFLISSGAAEVVAILAVIALGWPLPYTAAQILWINLVTNGIQHIALAVEPGEAHLLQHRPRGLRAGFFNWVVAQHTAVVGAAFSLGTLTTFRYAQLIGLTLADARTVAMTNMVMFQMWHAFSCRSLARSVFAIPLRTNPFLLVSVFAAIGAQALVIYWPPLQAIFGTRPIHLNCAVCIFFVSLGGVAAMEVSKWFARNRGALERG